MSRIKGAIKGAINRMGWDLRRVRYANLEATAIQDLLRLTNPTVVLDVGANAGQFGERLFACGYYGRLISFEAIPSVHRQLVQASQRRKGWIVAPCAAVGSKPGSAEINIAANSESSSMLAIRALHVAAAPDSLFVAKELVPIERLDRLSAALLTEQDKIYLKADTQGYEMEVLKGASGVLGRTVALQLEISLTSLYTNAPSASEMLNFVESLGFELFGLVPGFRDLRTGRLLQVDGFFARRSAIPAGAN